MTLAADDLARLGEWLTDAGSEFATIEAATQLKGGQSNPTYLLDTSAGPVVLRKRPDGAERWAHDVRREHTVLGALAATTVKTPTPHDYCDDASIVGGEFYLMEFVAGRIIDDCRLPGLDPEERTAVYRSMMECVAELHRVDPNAVGLADFGKPHGFVRRQVALHGDLFGRYRSDRSDDRTDDDRTDDNSTGNAGSTASDGSGDMEWLTRELAGILPDDTLVAIVNNDLRIGNLVLHPTEPKVISILDWEMSTLGDARADAALPLVPYHLPAGHPQGSLAEIDAHEREALGIPSQDQMIEWYDAAYGTPILTDPESMIAFNLFRYASVAAGIDARYRHGIAVSEDADRYAATVAPTAAAARRLAAHCTPTTQTTSTTRTTSTAPTRPSDGRTAR